MGEGEADAVGRGRAMRRTGRGLGWKLMQRRRWRTMRRTGRTMRHDGRGRRGRGMEKRRGRSLSHNWRRRWLLGFWGHRRPCLMFAPRPPIHSQIEFCPPCSLNPQGFDLDPLPGRAGDGLPSPKKPRPPHKRPRLGRVDVGDPALLRKGALALGGCVEDPRLGEGGDDEPPRRRAFVGVDDVGDVLGEREAPFRSGAGGFGGGGGSGGGSGGVCFGIRVDLLGDGVVEGAEVHRVGRLPSKVVLHQPKHRKVEGLGEV